MFCVSSFQKISFELLLLSNEFICWCYRIGFHYTVSHITSFPLLLLRSLARTHGNDRAAVESDIADKLYSSFIYIVIMVSIILNVILKYHCQNLKNNCLLNTSAQIF